MSPPAFLVQQKRQTQLPQLATRLTREEHILFLQRIVLNARVAAVASFLIFNELEPPSSITHHDVG